MENNYFSKTFMIFVVCLTLKSYSSTKGSDLNSKITKMVGFAKSNRFYHPTTLRYVSFTSSDESLLSSWERNLNLLDSMQSELYPIVKITSENISSRELNVHERKANVVSRKNLNTFITLVAIQRFEDFEKLKSIIKSSFDPRRDFIIFIAPGSVSELHESLRKLQGLREKYLIDSESQDEGVWVEPHLYNGNMVYFNINDFKPASAMGYNLRGRHLVASAPETPPYSFKIGKDPATGLAIVDGSLCKIFVESAKAFNFSYQIHYEGLDYGTLHPNGSWTGQYGRLHYPDSGFDVGLIISYEILWTQTDVGSLCTTIEMIFGVSHPITRNHWYAFLLPLDPEVWAWSIGSFIFLGAVQGVVLYFVQGRKVNNLVIDATYIIPFGMILEQGLQDIPKGIRYLSLILLVACTVIGTGYKSTLRTHLMFPKPDPVPTTFQELADASDYGVTLTVNGALEKHFWETSESKAVQKIRERLEYSNNWVSCYQSAFFDKKRSCVSWSIGKAIVAQTMTLNTTIDPLVFSKDAAITKFLSLGFQENSIYVDSFSPITALQGAMGIVEKWQQDIWKYFKALGRKHMLNQTSTPLFDELVQLAAPKEDAVPLKLDSLVVALAMIPASALLGGLVLIGEFYFNSRSRSRVNPLNA